MSSRDQIRDSIAAAITPLIAEMILKHDKAQPSYKLADLRNQDERAVFLAAVLELLSPARVAERMVRFDIVRAHTHAQRDHEQESVEAQARHDIARLERPVVARRCYLCGDPVELPDAYGLYISTTDQAHVHGACASADARCEVLSTFAFRWLGGTR